MKQNRLVREASPYLQQHANNPVDWYPWGDESLEAAKRLDRPILLSIGYSACHWCHVMERECFEDESIAKLMNEWFVNIKVDREERPDLDQLYQLAVQLLRRSGGWPLTVFLTPDQRPFFAGTYFPPADRHGMPGFPKVLQAIWEAYHARREEVAEQAAEMASAIASVSARGAGAGGYTLTADIVARAAAKLAQPFDDENGGFHTRPKFPNTMALEVLLRAGDGKRVRRALDAMRAGGIWDQLGGGFHRYSTDEKWLVPHFEKMLYDNALLLRLYVDGWRAFGHERYAETARAIAAYVAREMTDAGGGFYATQDADSEGHEGKFFVWDEEEIRAALPDDDEAAKAAVDGFGVTAAGNFDEHGVATHKTVLHQAKEPTDRPALDRAKRKLFDAREARPKPFRDEKILASWNGLMISSLADAGAALGDDGLIAMAKRAFAFVEKTLVRGGRVLRHAKGDVVKGPGFLDDHAYVARAALDLYEATGEPSYVARAREIADQVLSHFYDPKEPGFFFSPDDGEALIHRAKEPFDQAVPSGQSVICEVLLRLGALVDPSYGERARAALEPLSASALESPLGFGQTLSVLDRLVRGSTEVVVVGPRGDGRTRELARAAAAAWVQNRVIAWLDPADAASRAACAALAEGKEAKPEPSAYVCRDRTCSLPLSTPAEVKAAVT